MGKNLDKFLEDTLEEVLKYIFSFLISSYGASFIIESKLLIFIVALFLTYIVKEIIIYITSNFKWNGYGIVFAVASIIVLVALTVQFVPDYNKGDLLVTTTRVQFKDKAGVSDKETSKKNLILAKGTQVTCVKTYTKRTLWIEKGKLHNSFWTFVRLKDGREGWVYGAYLEKK